MSSGLPRWLPKDDTIPTPGAGAAVSLRPFAIVDKTVYHPDTGAPVGSYKVGIEVGHVNGLVPTLGGVSLAAIPPPEVNVVSFDIVRLRVAVGADYEPTSFTIVVEASGSLSSNTFTFAAGGIAWLTIGSLRISPAPRLFVTQNLTNNLVFWTAGGYFWTSV